MSNLKLLTVAELATYKSADLAGFFKTNADNGRVTYLNAAKAEIALADQLGGNDKARAALRKSLGAKYESAIKNAAILVSTYDSLVRPGIVDEKWFDSLIHREAVAINRLLDNVTVGKIKESVPDAVKTPNLLANEADEAQAAGWKLAPDRKAAKAAEAAAAAAKATADEAAFDAASAATGKTNDPEAAATTAADKAADVAADGKAVAADKKPEKSTVTAFGEIADTLEALAVEVARKGNDIDREKVAARLASIGKAFNDALEVAAAKKAKVAA